jgi:CRISPR-associated endonuclease/helicase Cas3
MRWQRRLFDRFVSNALPDTCDIPTGLGKTSVIVVWLLALAEQSRTGQVRLPRRLAYVVNRRTVVDQATTIVEGVRRRLLEPAAPGWQEHEAALNAITAALRKLCAFDGIPLAVSTLRGELADNEEWKADPARAAILVGTIDMIGSKLLFSGYGDGAYNRTHHAGLIGQDTLIIHDEAHLTPAFGALLRSLAEEQRGSDPKPIQVIELSATSRQSEENALVLKPEDEQDKIVRERLTAVKTLRIHRVPEDSIARKIVEISKTHEKSGCRVLVYVRTPDRAQEVANALAKALGKSAAERIAILTGTIRGHERDQLVKKNPVYRAFLDAAPVPKTVYLVSTSAGEVGIDLDADHMICDLTTLDSLIQRLGRVNRRAGEGRSAIVDIVGEPFPNAKPGNLNRAINRTLALVRLARLRARRDDAIDVSPGNIRILLKAAKSEWVEDAFSPKPKTPPLTDILLDSWSLTSIDKMPGRPEVEPFLHGL